MTDDRMVIDALQVFALAVRVALAEPASPEDSDERDEAFSPEPQRAEEDAANEDASLDADTTADPMALLAEAQRLRDAGDLEAALRVATAAIESDGSLAIAYLARAQLRVELADGSDRASTDEVETLLREAAADLDRYLAIAQLDAASFEAIRHERDQLIERARREAPIEAPKPSAPDDLEDRPVTPGTSTADAPQRAGPALVGLGSSLASVAVVLAAFGLRIEQRCPALCSASWTGRPGFLAASGAAAVLGTGLLATGTAHFIRRRAIDRRTARHLGAGLLVTAGMSAIASSITASMAARKWHALRPSDGAALSVTQSLANASLSLATTLPFLVTTGLVLVLERRSVPRRSSARANGSRRF